MEEVIKQGQNSPANKIRTFLIFIKELKLFPTYTHTHTVILLCLFQVVFFQGGSKWKFGGFEGGH